MSNYLYVCIYINASNKISFHTTSSTNRYHHVLRILHGNIKISVTIDKIKTFGAFPFLRTTLLMMSHNATILLGELCGCEFFWGAISFFHRWCFVSYCYHCNLSYKTCLGKYGVQSLRLCNSGIIHDNRVWFSLAWYLGSWSNSGSVFCSAMLANWG